MMESLERSKAIIELGKQIVYGLKIGDDVTAQWMAHLLAEKMSAANKAIETEQYSIAVIECVDIILQLWERKYALPSYMQPFKKLEPLLHTLNSLDVNKTNSPRYFQRMPSSKELESATEDEKNILKFAMGVDRAAKEVISYLLSTAAERPGEIAKPWLDSAAKSGLKETVEVELLLSNLSTEGMFQSQREARKQALLERADRLEDFADMAISLANEMRGKSYESDDESEV